MSGLVITGPALTDVNVFRAVLTAADDAVSWRTPECLISRYRYDPDDVGAFCCLASPGA